MTENKPLTVEDIKNNAEVKAFLETADRQLAEQGYTEHAYRHVGLVSQKAERY